MFPAAHVTALKELTVRSLVMAFLASLLAVSATVPLLLAGSNAASAAPAAGAEPIRAAFYYPWYPENWNQQGISPFSNYRPSGGYYDSGDPAVIARHIKAMRYGRIDAGIASWWGPGTPTDSRMPVLLSAAAGTGFKWAIYYETEAYVDSITPLLQADLDYIRTHYASDPSYLRVDGRFVVFVYAGASDGCEMADRWMAAGATDAYIVLKAFPGYGTCAAQPDSWHQYSPTSAAVELPGHSYTISPGFWSPGQPQWLTRDLARWQQNVRDMVASGERWQLITTFNEWNEGTSVESAAEWSTGSGYGAYLDVLHNHPARR